MQFFRFYILAITLALAGLTISLSACQKGGGSSAGGSDSTPSPSPTTPVARNSGGGGIDGSGGDLGQSSLEEVNKAYAEELTVLPRRLRHLADRYLQFDETIYDFQYGAGAYRTIGAFLSIDKNISSKSTSRLSEASPLLKSFDSGNIKIKAQKEPCALEDGVHAGSARGNFDKGEICISLEKLRSIPPFVLKQEIFTLLVHELSHISGLDEKHAVETQRLLAFHRDMYAEYQESGFINGLQACDVKALSKEVEDLKNSPYWQEQKKKLVDLLSGSQPRGCGEMSNAMTDRVDIFTDDAEFLEVTPKFPRAGYRWELYDKARGYDGTYYYYNSVQEISEVATIHLETSTAIIWNIDAKVGTDAQCSPKILMANLIANVPDVLKMGCGAGGDGRCNGDTETCQKKWNEVIRARVLKEKEILDGDPDKKK